MTRPDIENIEERAKAAELHRWGRAGDDLSMGQVRTVLGLTADALDEVLEYVRELEETRVAFQTVEDATKEAVFFNEQYEKMKAKVEKLEADLELSRKLEGLQIAHISMEEWANREWPVPILPDCDCGDSDE